MRGKTVWYTEARGARDDKPADCVANAQRICRFGSKGKRTRIQSRLWNAGLQESAYQLRDALWLFMHHPVRPFGDAHDGKIVHQGVQAIQQ